MAEFNEPVENDTSFSRLTQEKHAFPVEPFESSEEGTLTLVGYESPCFTIDLHPKPGVINVTNEDNFFVMTVDCEREIFNANKNEERMKELEKSIKLHRETLELMNNQIIKLTDFCCALVSRF